MKVTRHEVCGIEIYDIGHGFSVVSASNTGYVDLWEEQLSDLQFGFDDWYIALADFEQVGCAVYFLGNRVVVDGYDKSVKLVPEVHPQNCTPYVTGEFLEYLDVVKIGREL